MAYLFTGDRKTAVRRVQETLRDREYSLASTAQIPVDGIYGDVTREAVKKFQNDFGLRSDGIVDLKTWRMLETERLILADLLTPAVIAQLYPYVYEYVWNGSNEDSYIRILQIMLRELGVHYGSAEEITPTGRYDAETQAAVKEFQKKNGLPPDGRLTVPTRQRIAEDYETLLRNTK